MQPIHAVVFLDAVDAALDLFVMCRSALFVKLTVCVMLAGLVSQV